MRAGAAAALWGLSTVCAHRSAIGAFDANDDGPSENPISPRFATLSDYCNKEPHHHGCWSYILKIHHENTEQTASQMRQKCMVFNAEIAHQVSPNFALYGFSELRRVLTRVSSALSDTRTTRATRTRTHTTMTRR